VRSTGYRARVIRAAAPSDLPTIVALIGELAEYEHLAHEVVLDADELADHLFGPRPAAEVLIAETDAGDAVGFALFFHNFSTFLGRPGLHLEDLFVRPDHRGGGHGRALLRELGRIARARRCGRIEWNVLDWNDPSIAFYRSLGALAMDEWVLYRLTGEAMAELADP
jgi:GNAT superfamily N-acetyltransferase